MDNEPAVKPMSAWVLVIVLIAIVVGLGLALKIGYRSQRGNKLPPSFSYELKPDTVDPALVKYQQTAEIPLAMRQARAVAVGPDDRVYVAGDQAIVAFDASGSRIAEIALEDQPRCLAVGGSQHIAPGRLYVGMNAHVEVYEPTGKRTAAWDRVSERSTLTSIAVSERDVFVADAGSRVVLRYDAAGKLLGRIGQPDKSRNIRGFVIPSPYFDVAMAADGLLRVVNPGYHHVEAYTVDGDLEFHWGEASFGIEGFCGCCNPAHFAILPDGRFVTAEKGMPRVKVYGADGKFEAVVAPPETFVSASSTRLEETRSDHKLPVLDVAADSRGRVLVLDPGAGRVRIFEPLAGKEGK